MILIKQLISHFLFLISILILFHCSSPSPKKKFVYADGWEIMTPDGKPFLIRGTNLGNWLVPEGYMFKFKTHNSPRRINQLFSELIGPDETRAFWKKYLNAYITAEDIRYMKSLGMNSIRVPFHYLLFTNQEYLGGSDPERGFELLDRVIGWCRNEGMYVILDMHCAPGGQSGDNIDDSWGYPFLFLNEESKELTTQIWRRIAARYRNEEMIMGYDLLNEPIAHYFDTLTLVPHLEPLYKKIVTAVREVDQNHLIFLGGAHWNTNFSIFGPPFDDKLVYTFHKYWCDTTQGEIQQYLDFRKKYNVPIYIGETGENTDQWVGGWRRLMERNNIGWHFWPYKKMENTKGIVQFEKPEQYDILITYEQTSRLSYEDIRKNRPVDMTPVYQALEGFLNNCRYENCSINKGYVEGLGLKIIEIKN